LPIVDDITLANYIIPYGCDRGGRVGGDVAIDVKEMGAIVIRTRFDEGTESAEDATSDIIYGSFRIEPRFGE
jgi:hypothetical protein